MTSKHRVARAAAALIGSVGLLGGGIVLSTEGVSAAASKHVTHAIEVPHGKYAGCSDGTASLPLPYILGAVGTLLCIVVRTL